MAVILRKLLRIGKLPADMRGEVERAIDQRWDAPQDGPVTAEFSHDGLALRVDVAQVDPAFSGQLSLHYKTAIPEPVLTIIPRRSLAFEVPREWVSRAVGVPAPRPA